MQLLRLLRLLVLSALLLLLAAGGCSSAGRLRSSGSHVVGRLDGHGMVEGVGRYPGTAAVGLTRMKTPSRGSRSQQRPDGHLWDLQHRDKFIRHLTGPLYFSPKCRKHFNRLYHNTRDCIVPAYYKRCARLLTRLASSPLCTER